jgi:regulatory protein
VPRDAEAWLAARGIEREPIALDVSVAPEEAAAGTAVPDPTVREVLDLARQVVADTPTRPVPAGEPERGSVTDVALEDGGPEGSGPEDAGAAARDPVGAALAFIHRSTANAPQSEGRLRDKLAERGYAEDVADEALAQARAARLVDDGALLAALIGERRARGHADLRLRQDLRSRGFTGPQIDEALERHRDEDPSAAAFALAREQAARQRGVEAEAAVRRIVGFLVRRGHSEALARKAARDAVYADREPQRSAER